MRGAPPKYMFDEVPIVTRLLRFHLPSPAARQRTIVLDTVDRQLQYQPTVRTKNRKPLRPNLLAPWQLQIRNLRVFYSVKETPERVVYIHAIGIKKGNKLRIGKKVINL